MIGKYAIKGYPHKLGLMLYGPPGTGKTSLIKALALRTKRHIVNVPLARITSNQVGEHSPIVDLQPGALLIFVLLGRWIHIFGALDLFYILQSLTL